MFNRWLAAVLIGVVVATIVGALAWMLSPVAPTISAIVFTFSTLPFGVMLGWIVAVAPKTTPPHPTPPTRWSPRG